MLCDGVSHVGRLLTHRRRTNCSRIRPWLQAKAEHDPVLRFDLLAAWEPDNSLSMHSRLSNLAQLASAHLPYVKFRLQIEPLPLWGMIWGVGHGTIALWNPIRLASTLSTALAGMDR